MRCNRCNGEMVPLFMLEMFCPRCEKDSEQRPPADFATWISSLQNCVFFFGRLDSVINNWPEEELIGKAYPYKRSKTIEYYHRDLLEPFDVIVAARLTEPRADGYYWENLKFVDKFHLR